MISNSTNNADDTESPNCYWFSYLFRLHRSNSIKKYRKQMCVGNRIYVSFSSLPFFRIWPLKIKTPSIRHMNLFRLTERFFSPLRNIENFELFISHRRRIWRSRQTHICNRFIWQPLESFSVESNPVITFPFQYKYPYIHYPRMFWMQKLKFSLEGFRLFSSGHKNMRLCIFFSLSLFLSLATKPPTISLSLCLLRALEGDSHIPHLHTECQVLTPQ